MSIDSINYGFDQMIKESENVNKYVNDYIDMLTIEDKVAMVHAYKKSGDKGVKEILDMTQDHCDVSVDECREEKSEPRCTKIENKIIVEL